MRRPLAAALAAFALAAPLSVTWAKDAPADAQTYLRRIAALDDAGPQINAVIVTADDAGEQARQYAGSTPLDGRTVLVKDNIETREWPTTAGSLALADNATGRDATLIANLRAAGGVVLGKTNLSEWANFRSNASTSGWSAVGGITRNPHATDRNACGSSSGSGAAVAAGFAWAAIGTETDGSITCPASVNGVVGFKPTVGLVSRTHVVPLSASQDTAGPMARSVEDAAMLLKAIAGSDPLDPATAEADAHLVDFSEGLGTATLEGVRIGVVRGRYGGFEPLGQVWEQALADLRRAGAVLVDVEYEPSDEMGEAEYIVLLHEFQRDIESYLKGSPADIPVRSLEDLIAFNAVHALSEMRWFGQDVFEAALESRDVAAYEEALVTSRRLAREEGIDRLLSENDVAFLIAPTRGPAWNIDLVLGDHWIGGIGIGSMAAVAGYPHLTVPMGHVEGLPVGLSFIGSQWDDHAILRAGAAYEKARSVEIPEPSFRPWAPWGATAAE
ncbi:amidase [Aurantiacibacter poecillastricola]|uniref:amidase n=1 Tax=Aurantiacibacter poecillastricola TaxID=3064385 RepID=UPI00273DC789|nr:amidase [Aurantiacibacter sp. 219JJ12-13]MDP5262778.1 amidase [Aurantiacibacter sp. 219JJ12-13]